MLYYIIVYYYIYIYIYMYIRTRAMNKYVELSEHKMKIPKN